MTTYYVDTTVSGGLDNGSSWANAWNDLQAAIDKPLAAGDVVLCYSNGDTNKESPGATIDFDGTSGSNSSGGYIKFIGCSTNSGDGSPDGTKYVLDGGGARDPIIALNSLRIWIENFRFTNASGDGVNTGGINANIWVWINCIFDNNGDCGWSCSSNSSSTHWFIGCQFYGNTGDGLEAIAASAYYTFVNCVVYQNGGRGIDGIQSQNGILSRCLIFDNGDSNINLAIAHYSIIDSCIIDGTNQSSENGIYLGGDLVYVFATRITNSVNGIEATDNLGIVGWCLFDGNTNDSGDATDTLLYHLPFQSDLDLTSNKGVFSEGNPAGSTNKFDPDTDDGYEDATSLDYNVKTSRTYNGDGTDTVGFNVGS